MERPYVICHMLMSIDGKVTGDFLYEKSSEIASEIYYQKNRNYKTNAFACGRVTMETSFTNNKRLELSKTDEIINKNQDYVAKNDFKYFAVSFDRLGRVGWVNDHIVDIDEGYNNAHIIEVLSRKTSNEYLKYLKEKGISYIFAGDDDIDINVALNKLYKLFPIKTLLLEGGSIINQAFLDNNLVDELSLVVAPIIANNDSKSLFYEGKICDFELKTIEKYGDIVYLNYKKK